MKLTLSLQLFSVLQAEVVDGWPATTGSPSTASTEVTLPSTGARTSAAVPPCSIRATTF